MKKNKIIKSGTLISAFLLCSIQVVSALTDEDGEEIRSSSYCCCFRLGPTRSDKAEHYYKKGLRNLNNEKSINAILALEIARALGHQKAKDALYSGLNMEESQSTEWWNNAEFYHKKGDILWRIGEKQAAELAMSQSASKGNMAAALRKKQFEDHTFLSTPANYMEQGAKIMSGPMAMMTIGFGAYKGYKIYTGDKNK